MRIFYPIFTFLFFLFFSCTSNQSAQFSVLPDINTNDTTIREKSTDDDIDASTLVFKNQLCYKYIDELGNISEYEIGYQPKTGIMYVITSEVIPMIDGILIYPDASYTVLGVNERGNKVSFTYKNKKDLVVEVQDEAGVSYPKEHPYTDYQLNEGSALVYRDGLKGSQEFIKSKLFTITFERTGEHMNLYVTDAYPILNARLLYGLAHIPGDVGEFFKPFGELWNISSKQWPTLISNNDYSLKMTCFGATDYHVDPSLYPAAHKTAE
ncbi:MAG: hypothetical protein ABIN48_04590 [Ginsengibacter sp.]